MPGLKIKLFVLAPADSTLNMPARTNPFQELVALIKQSLASTGDKIRESVEVPGVGLDDPREIDILHETTDGITTLRIAVETKDEGRPVSVQTIDEYCGKYTGEGRVPVDKFMIVSRNGFTEGAREKAKLRGIPLLTLDEAKEVNWAKVGAQDEALLKGGGFQFRMAPHFHEIVVSPALPAELAERIIREGKIRGPACPINCEHGTLLGCLSDNLINGDDPRVRAATNQMHCVARTNPDGALIQYNWKFEDGRRIRFDEVDYALDAVSAVVHTVNSFGVVTCKHYELTSSENSGTQLFHHFSAEVGSWQFDWVLPEGIGAKQMALKIGSSDTAKAKRPNPKERAAERAKKRKSAKRKRGE